MLRRTIPSGKATVALLAEGVDRNCIKDTAVALSTTSPSSRRAWIEISNRAGRCVRFRVALLAEGVDRNFRSTLCGV